MNAKEELLAVLKNDLKMIACASIEFNEQVFELKMGYNRAQLNEFLDKLDFRYGYGFGAQHLFGIVWLKSQRWLERAEYDASEWWVLNQRWLERAEYDASEWWVLKECPAIPKELQE